MEFLQSFFRCHFTRKPVCSLKLLHFTLLAESLRSFLDESGKRKRLCRHLQVKYSFDLSIIQCFGWVRQVSYWINQFYLCTHTYSGVLLTLSVPTLHNKINSCCFNFVQEFWENYRLNVQFEKNWKMHPDLRWILFWI